MKTNFISNLNLDCSEELNDQVSEKISGGSNVDAQIDAQIIEQLRIIQTLGDPNLQTRVVEQIKEIFPEGIGNAASLSCAQDNEHLKCQISSNEKKEDFVVPLN